MSVCKSFENCMQCHFGANNYGCVLHDCEDCGASVYDACIDAARCQCIKITDGERCHYFVSQSELCELCLRHVSPRKHAKTGWPACNGRFCDQALKMYREVQYV